MHAQTLKTVARRFVAIQQSMQYGSPHYERAINQTIRELHKCRGLEPFGQCPKCGNAGVWTTCPRCVVPTVKDSRKANL